MTAYRVQSKVKNGQIILDLPEDFADLDVEIVVSQLNPTYETPPKTPRNYLDFMPNKRAFDAVDRLLIERFGGDDFVRPPVKKVDWKALYGSAKEPKMTAEEIDNLVKTWRDEWEIDNI